MTLHSSEPWRALFVGLQAFGYLRHYLNTLSGTGGLQ
jgi:hypothetical protein